MVYNDKIIDFFKRHNMYDEKTFKYLQANSTMIDYRCDEERAFIGCFYILNKKEELERLQLNIPYVYDDKTALINIHEIVHGIENYSKLGEKFKKDITIETLPILYEHIFIIESTSSELKRYGKYLDRMIETSNELEYLFALKVRLELINKYQYNMKKMQKLTKKLSHKYQNKI